VQFPLSMETSSLSLDAVIGFAGDVNEGLLLHPDDKHVIYPLGSNIVIRDISHSTQRFLQNNGHDRAISCISISRSGAMLCTGQMTHMGFPAVAIIWDIATGCNPMHFVL
jgi:hypothetical protein